MDWKVFADAVSSVATGQLLEDLISPVIQRLTFGGELQQLVDHLRRGLLTAKAVLDEAEEKQIISPSVINWVNELQDAAYQVEDLLDETETKHLKLGLSNQDTSTLKSEIEKLMENFNIHREKLLKEIDEKLKNLAGARDLLNLKASVRQKPPTTYPTTSLADESEVIGRDEDIKELKNSLRTGNAQQNKIPLIAIVGLGGVGKTRLAQHLWEEMQNEFELKAWAFVSEGSDVVGVTITILQSFNLDKYDVRDLNILQLRLKQKLGNQKFLLVLDNIWDDDYLNCWDLLSRPLRAGKCESRIIVTTRNQNVASKMGADVTYPLRPLSEIACRSLFEKHAFQGDPNPSLKEIGVKIARKCEGLPLAAKTLGGILRPKLEAEEWEKILDSKIWDAAYSNILPALILSYYDLPGYLKKCFAYCSIFPKGYEIDKDKLVLLWMAQGFLEKTNSKDTMEKVGEEYGRELLSRSLFQSSGNGLCFVMHDLINDLAQFASGKFCCKFENGKTHAIWEKARHFAFDIKQPDALRTFVNATTARSLRTFLPVSFLLPTSRFLYDDTITAELLKKMECSRVLSFSCYIIYDLPDSLGELKHLRYLDLSHTFIAKLPDKTCSLYNLQTLLLSDCCRLQALPENIGNLVNLRHLDVSDTFLPMPTGFKRLKSLQVMINFVSTGSESEMGELSELSLLRMLSISSMENVVDAEASKAGLRSKLHLKELGLKWKSNTVVQSTLQVFENLRPHKNLKKLTVENYGDTAFPNWLGHADFSNMVSLTLRNCNNCVSLPSLGNLSSLQDFEIEGGCGSMDSFPEEHLLPTSLTSLRIGKLPNLKFLGRGLHQLICLNNLEITDCANLSMPAEKLPASLDSLRVQNCPELAEDYNTDYGSLNISHIANVDIS